MTKIVPVELYPIVAIPNDHPALLENLGTKEKFWIEHDGLYSLLKFGRAGTGEDWAEKLACELCSLLGLAHAHYDLAECNGRTCVLTPNLVQPGGRLVLGNELINYVSANYDGTRAYQQREHTVSRVLASLKVHTPDFHQETWHNFLGYLLLDAWIGNTDRHHENWGLLRAPSGEVRLAPTFDHASSLGRELTDAARLNRLQGLDPRVTVKSYALRARSALYVDPSDKKPLSPMGAFLFASRAQRQSGFFWLEKLQQVSDLQVSGVIERIPAKCMSAPAKEFAMALLTENRAALLSVLGDKS